MRVMCIKQMSVSKRERVNSGVSQKHLKKRSLDIKRFKCTRQKSISNNKIKKELI